MTITVTGKEGEGKSCVANIIRNALIGHGLFAEANNIPVIDEIVAADILVYLKVDIKIVEIN